ncbi:MAG: MinD/ParA family protein [Deltaproteobacteria bacterium]|nr:MinD/ParA family protein [Deltaproteobacteria bacterium]MBW1953126.1 MinD/ParA family protein [Deltaproteobacteria bacterium]MBW1987004.1 MinD/ParA family protein [Deltaproteobacteria bacterium]MBW2134039.1 MinD/ParA family protein [Deltaproteobacteria bacterium]
MDPSLKSSVSYKDGLFNQVALDSDLRPRVIAVTSGKGGVGKSNIVVNLGLVLTRLGKKVLIIDADLGLANIDVLLGLSPRFNIKDVFSGQKKLAEVIIECPCGMKILPAASGFQDMAELDRSQKLFLLNELDNYSENLDIVLIDTGAGISSNVLYFNIAAQERIVVVKNEPTSVTDAYALIKVLVTKYAEKRFKLLINYLSQPKEAEVVYRNLTMIADRFLGGEVAIDYLGFIPQDGAIPKAILKQQAVTELFPRCSASRCFTEIAHRLLEMNPSPELDGNIKFFWRRLATLKV